MLYEIHAVCRSHLTVFPAELLKPTLKYASGFWYKIFLFISETDFIDEALCFFGGWNDFEGFEFEVAKKFDVITFIESLLFYIGTSQLQFQGRHL